MAENPSLDVISICGSLRKGSYNAMVARALPDLAPAGMTIRPAPSFADFPIYNADIQNEQGFPGAVTAFADAIRAADGVVIVTPEYNFSVPGGLKNALDWVSRLPNQPFAEKPVAVQSASPGPVGGARMLYDLRKILVFLEAFTLNKPEIFVNNVASRVNEKTGELTDDTTRDFIRQQLAAFAKLITRVERKR
ncbi:MAG: NADPH-dependent FMN reductase [Xanthobacteraceae bacterium]